MKMHSAQQLQQHAGLLVGNRQRLDRQLLGDLARLQGRRVGRDIGIDQLVEAAFHRIDQIVDEAFLRRLRHKIEIGDPSYEEYREIFKRVAQAKKVEYSDQGLAYLLQEWYIKRNRKLRASHPRDLCDQIIDISGYLAVPPTMSRDMLDRAAMAYFVDI